MWPYPSRIVPLFGHICRPPYVYIRKFFHKNWCKQGVTSYVYVIYLVYILYNILFTSRGKEKGGPTGPPFRVTGYPTYSGQNPPGGSGCPAWPGPGRGYRPAIQLPPILCWMAISGPFEFTGVMMVPNWLGLSIHLLFLAWSAGNYALLTRFQREDDYRIRAYQSI